MIIPAGSKKIQRVLVKGFLIVFNKLLFIRGFKGISSVMLKPTRDDVLHDDYTLLQSLA